MPLRLKNVGHNRLFLLIGIGIIIFISFQLLSLRVLSRSAWQSSRDIIDVIDDKRDEDYDEKDVNVMEIENNENDKKTTSKTLKSPVSSVRGVNPDEADLYIPDKDQMFTCLHSKKLVPFTNVNDDYCDCDDNTDEPGTSACDRRFYCKKQFPNQVLVFLPSNRVNDGICDCCDGSDEWKQTGPPNDVVPGDRTKLAVKYAPCEDKCENIIQANQEDQKIHMMGKRLKISYLNAAKHLTDKSSYGPDGVFYKLSQSCFKYKTGGYEYNVCPFKKVTQEHFPSAPFTLGKFAEWVHMKNGRYVLRMDGGDSLVCPDGLSRSTIITFLCGLQDRIISLQEDEKCVYGMKFSTPAAC